MSGLLNKIKEAIVGEPAENPNIASTATGAKGNDGYNTGSDYSSTNRSGLGSNTGPGIRGDTERAHEGLSSGVEGSRLTNMGGLGQVGQESGSGVGTGFPGSTGHTGSMDKYGDGLDRSSGKPGVAGLEHHGKHGGGLSGSEGRYERELETGAMGSGFEGGDRSRQGEYSGAGTTGTGIGGSGFEAGDRSRQGEYSGAGTTGMSGTTGTGGSHLTRDDIAGRIEPHRHENENFDQYATPSQFSHGKHEGFGSSTTGTGMTGQGMGSGTGRSSGVGNEFSSSGRNDGYDNQTGSNTGSGTAPHSSSLLNKLDPRVDNNQTGRNV